MFAFTEKDVDAKIVNNALVVSRLGTDQPRVWRADMTGLSSATLDVMEEKGKYSVVLRRNGAAPESIVTFNDKDSASYALRTLSDAMLKGEARGVIQGGGGVFGTLLRTLVVVGIVLGLGSLVVSHLFTPPATDVSTSSRVPIPALGKSSGSKVESGKPVPADQLFGK